MSQYMTNIATSSGNTHHSRARMGSLYTNPGEEIKVELAWSVITDDGCEDICRTILDFDNEMPVKVLDLIDNQLGPAKTQKIASVLETSVVRDVLLRYNNIGKEGCDALASVVNVSAKLQLLDLRGNGLSAVDTRKLLKSISMSTSVTRLCLSANKLGVDGAALLFLALEKNAYLTSLDVSLNELGPTGAASIAQLLELPAVPLKTLQLYGNRLGPAGIQSIAAAMRRNHCLTFLTLGNNNATDASAEELAAMLRENNTLESLDLRLNTITPSGARVLARDGLASNTSLTSLCLSGNPIGSVGSDELAKALTMHQNGGLTNLDLSSCELGPTGGMRIANLIGATITLSDVNLSDNKIDDEAAAALSRSIVNSIAITSVDLTSNVIGEWGASNLIEAAQLNARMSSLVLHGNNISRVVQKKIDALLGDRLARNTAKDQGLNTGHQTPILKQAA